MAYLYEVHLHTCRSSACGISTPAEYIPFYKKRGFDGVFITEHFYQGNTCIDRSLPWTEWVKHFCAGYREMKELGEKAGLKVFFAWETTMDGDDYLIYGLGEDFLLAHPEMIGWDQKKQYEEVKTAGGLVIQAHPYRSRDYLTGIYLHPHQCDGWEVANCGNKPYENYLARKYAQEHHMIQTCGSDIHTVDMAERGAPYAMALDEPLETEMDYVRTILSGKGFTYQVPEDAFSEKYVDLGLPIQLFE